MQKIIFKLLGLQWTHWNPFSSLIIVWASPQLIQLMNSLSIRFFQEKLFFFSHPYNLPKMQWSLLHLRRNISVASYAIILPGRVCLVHLQSSQFLLLNLPHSVASSECKAGKNLTVMPVSKSIIIGRYKSQTGSTRTAWVRVGSTRPTRID